MKEKYMLEAIKEAKKAAGIDEVPVGCVIVCNDKIIAKGYNKKEANNDPLGHAEIIAIRKATKKLGSWRLNDCDLYVTLEPCLMCCGAIIHSRIRKVFYGTDDPRGGGVTSLTQTFDLQGLNHYVRYEEGILKDECGQLLKDYFKSKRGLKVNER